MSSTTNSNRYTHTITHTNVYGHVWIINYNDDNNDSNVSVALELNGLIYNLRPYYSMFVRLQREANYIKFDLRAFDSRLGKMSNL